MKTLLYIILFILGASIFLMFLPLAIGGFLAYYNFGAGNYGWGIISLVLGLVFQGIFFVVMNDGSIGGGGDCPSCGGGDTDGNHCYTCGDDF